MGYRVSLRAIFMTWRCWRPSGMATAHFRRRPPWDLMGDRNPDLAVVNSNSKDISILLGNGDGTFRIAVNYSGGTSPVSLALGDFTGDGKIDLAVANSHLNSVATLKGIGDGTFVTGVGFGAGIGPI